MYKTSLHVRESVGQLKIQFFLAYFLTTLAFGAIGTMNSTTPAVRCTMLNSGKRANNEF